MNEAEFVKLYKELITIRPEGRSVGKRTAYGTKWDRHDKQAPLFTEAFLYSFVGKEEARAILSTIKRLARAAGFDPDELEEQAWDERNALLKEELRDMLTGRKLVIFLPNVKRLVKELPGVSSAKIKLSEIKKVLSLGGPGWCRYFAEVVLAQSDHRTWSKFVPGPGRYKKVLWVGSRLTSEELSSALAGLAEYCEEVIEKYAN